MKSQGSDTKRNKLIEKGKRMGVDEIIKQNGTINNNLEYNKKLFFLYTYIKTRKLIKMNKMSLFCIKCKKFTGDCIEVNS